MGKQLVQRRHIRCGCAIPLATAESIPKSPDAQPTQRSEMGAASKPLAQIVCQASNIGSSSANHVGTERNVEE